MKFTIYSDPSHGWCKVNRDLLKKLGIADKISIYSYQRKDAVYLEEDCDLGLLIEALKKAGKTFEYREMVSNKSSKIRSYDNYVNY